MESVQDSNHDPSYHLLRLRHYIRLKNFNMFSWTLNLIYISWINYISSFHTKFYYIVYPIKAAFLILYIILFAFYLDNAFRITAYIIFLIMMLIVTAFRFEYVNAIWSLLCFMVPVFGLPALLVICFTCQCFKYCWEGKKEINEKEAKKEQNKNKLNEKPSPNIDEHSHKLPQHRIINLMIYRSQLIKKINWKRMKL